MNQKMTTVNALKCKHPENAAKRHFTYPRQCLAHSNSTSKDAMKLFSSGKHVVTHCWHSFGSLQLKLLSLSICFILTKITMKEKLCTESGSLSFPLSRHPCHPIVRFLSSPLSSCPPLLVSIPLYTPVISTHNPPYEQWLVGMGVGAGCLLLLWRS
jgi:hypothetical protein